MIRSASAFPAAASLALALTLSPLAAQASGSLPVAPPAADPTAAPTTPAALPPTVADPAVPTAPSLDSPSVPSAGPSVGTGLPPAVSLAPEVNNPPTATPAQAAPEETSAGAYRTVEVRSGDTLYSIARRAGISTGELEAANPGQPLVLAEGQNITIPGKPNVIGAIVEPPAPPRPGAANVTPLPAPPAPPAPVGQPPFTLPPSPQPPQTLEPPTVPGLIGPGGGMAEPALPHGTAMRVPDVSVTPAPFHSASPRPSPAENSPLLTDRRFDARFSGANASEVAAYLSFKIPGLNVMLPNNADKIMLPNIELKEVNLKEFMAALTAASKADLDNGNPGYSLSPVPGAPNILIFQQIAPSRPDIPADPFSGAMPGTPYPSRGGVSFAGTLPATTTLGTGGGGGLGGSSYDGPGQPAPRSQSAFFDLSSILQNGELKVDDITTAIRTAWSSVEGGKVPPEGALKFHQETKLLIVTGTPEYLSSATSIVEILQNRIKPSKDEKDQKVAALMQQLKYTENNQVRMDQDRRLEEEKSRELKDKLQARITDLELELAKLQHQQVK